MDPTLEFPLHTLREYALLADGERGALIGPRGDVTWMCAPNWHSEAVFSLLIGGSGCYAVTPTGRYTWGGYYDRRSLIWNSRWVTNDAIIESREALAMPSEPSLAVILRQIRVREGSARLQVILDVRAGFGTAAMRRLRKDADGVWTGSSGPLSFRWAGGAEANHSSGGPLTLDLSLKAGDVYDLVLEIAEGSLPDERPHSNARWSATEACWRQAVPDLGASALAPRDAEHAMAILSGLTSSAGGMAAAATMSLPERAKEGRNYDYRYAWIRDQCFAGCAVASHRHFPLLDSAVGFVSQRLLEDGPDLKPAYTVSGGAVPGEHVLPGLSGYPGGSNVVGNHVTGQFQLDTFGEALELFAVASSTDHLDAGHWNAVEAAVSAIEARWQEPDAGVWELEDARWAHSRLACVSGLRAVANEAPPSQAGRWSALADAILSDVGVDCLHPNGRWQRSPTDPRVDAALLLPVVRSGLSVDDPRSRLTMAAVREELAREGYVYRFQQDPRPLGEAEGAFLLCGLLLAIALDAAGDHLEGRALFERARSACGSPGILSEEFDVEQRQLRGNLPQAFVHALLLEASALLHPDRRSTAGGMDPTANG